MPRSRQDWTLLALACAAGKMVTSVELQKGLFFLTRQIPDVAAWYAFERYRFLDRSVYQDLEQLEADGLVQVTQGSISAYAVTPSGIERAKKLRKNVPHATRFLERWWTGART